MNYFIWWYIQFKICKPGILWLYNHRKYYFDEKVENND